MMSNNNGTIFACGIYDLCLRFRCVNFDDECFNARLNFFAGPIKEDSSFKDDDPSVDYVDIVGTEEQLVSMI